MPYDSKGPDALDRLLRSSVNLQTGVVARRIFVDEDVYALEQKRIFGKCWLFLAHETQIPDAGDYVTAKIGETPVIVVRGGDGLICGFINSCRHRGNPVTRCDFGNANSFTCPYHGWCYNASDTRIEVGKLIGIPGRRTYYHNKLDQGAWGLVPVAQVASYKGLIFGTLDPGAPSLDEFLGDMRWALDILLDQGDLAAVPGLVRWQMKCNWKFAADNAIGDNAHAQVAHKSAFAAFDHMSGGTPSGGGARAGVQPPGFTVLTAYGHGLNAPMAEQLGERHIYGNAASDWWRNDSQAVERMGPFRARVLRYNMNVFPNLFIIDRLLMMRNPLGPRKTEIRAIALYDRNAPAEVQREEIRTSFLKFGPSGLLEQEDGENWDQATVGAGVAPLADRDLNYAMGLGAGAFIDDGQSPPRIDTVINETGQLWFYRFWADAMLAETWDELNARQLRPTGTF